MPKVKSLKGTNISWLLLLALTVLSLSNISCADIGQEKLAKIQKLQSASSNGIIVFNEKNYEELVIQNPRPYDVVILYTVAAHCQHCDDVLPEFEGAVYSFIQEAHKLGKHVFFGILYHTKAAQNFYILHGIKTVPYLTVSQQKTKRLETEPFYKEEDKWLVRSDQVFETQVIIDFFNKRLNTDVKLVLPFSTLLFRNIILLTIVGVFVSLFKYIRMVLLEPKVWFLIAMSVFLICTGGIVYSILHSVPWFKFERDQNGNIFVAEYFMKGQRGQWAGEGYIFSFLVTGIGFVWLFIVRIDNFVQRNFNKRVGIILACLGIFVLIQLLLMCYRIKSPWYGPGFWPPDHYQKGPLSKDQGMNI